MAIRILPEQWVDDRQMFVFRCEEDRTWRWTFCVHQRTLEELDDDAFYDRAGIFDAFREKIYRVARERSASADPAGQHEITAGEIREAGWAPHR